jgi:ribosomal protein S18 acetylase RimI-like enzyme
MTEVTVARADLDDPRHRRDVVEMINAYARDPMGRGADLPDDVRARLAAGLRAHPTALVFLAYDSLRPVGVAVCFEGFSTFAARPLVNVHDLAVIPEYRGRGVGRRLLEAVEAAARERGCCKITLEVLSSNHLAQRVYERAGFENLDPGGCARMWFLEKAL